MTDQPIWKRISFFPVTLNANWNPLVPPMAVAYDSARGVYYARGGAGNQTGGPSNAIGTLPPQIPAPATDVFLAGADTGLNGYVVRIGSDGTVTLKTSNIAFGGNVFTGGSGHPA